MLYITFFGYYDTICILVKVFQSLDIVHLNILLFSLVIMKLLVKVLQVFQSPHRVPYLVVCSILFLGYFESICKIGYLRL